MPISEGMGASKTLQRSDFDMVFWWFLEVPSSQDQGGSIPHIKISLPSKRRLYSIQFDGSFYKKLFFFFTIWGNFFFTPPWSGAPLAPMRMGLMAISVKILRRRCMQNLAKNWFLFSPKMMKFRIQLFLIISRTDPKIEKKHFWLVQLIRISEKFCVEWARFHGILIFSIFRSSGHPPKIFLPQNKKFWHTISGYEMNRCS